MIVVAAIGTGVFSTPEDDSPTILTESQLQEVVNVSKLSSARSVYEGIATKKDGDDVKYRVYYKSSVTASIDMADISFTIDEETKIVYPQLPELQIESPTVDTKSLEFFEQNPDVNMKDVIKLCKKDAQSKVNNDSDIKSTAESNLKKTIEALTSPLLKSKGYTLSWDAPAEEAEDAQQE